MKCGIVTPIGPGHEGAYQSAVVSIEIAARKSQGPFDAIELFPVYDLKGELGRSKARNLGVERAHAAGCDWIFFLDADDLMFEEAFRSITDLVHAYDAIWGLICEAPHGRLDAVQLRPNQLPPTTSIYDLLKVDPFLSIQMGVFVRTAIALQNPFDEAMDTGEDFKFYLACWTQCRCVKGKFILFVNVRGNHSTGPRSANGLMWRESVTRQIQETRTHLVYSSSQFNQPAMKAFIIHNPEAPQSVELAERCLASCVALEQPAQLVAGVPKHAARKIALDLGYNVNSYDYIETHQNRPLRDGQIGCFLAHREQWIRCIQLDQPIIILEHDAILLERLAEYKAFQHVLNLQRVVWDDPAWPWHAKMQTLVDVAKARGDAKYLVLPGTSAYAITPQGALLLLKSSMNMLPVDLYANKSVVRIDDHPNSIVSVTNDFSLVAP